MNSIKVYPNNNETQNLINSPTRMEEGVINDNNSINSDININQIDIDNKLIIIVDYNDTRYTINISLLHTFLYLFEFLVLFIDNILYNIIVVIIAIILYIRQIGRIDIILNMFITVCILMIAVNNLGIIQKDFIKTFNDLHSNDTTINCNTMTTQCFNNYIDFKFNTSNVNKKFVC